MGCLLFAAQLVSAETLEDIKQNAEQGNALGQAKLASLYLLGRNGVEIDNIQAAKWMKKAADQGLVEAQVVVAAMYDRGMGLKGDKKIATQWYEKAAKQGHGTSLAILGRNPTAKGSVGFSYQGMRLNASRSIPKEYAKRFLMRK
ncbi:MAG: sel1 repeat family protein [Methylococcales bacterium]|nr:sel1 repeat family protein [Methylococcales bacterium]